jgi:cytochrome c oxidase cbb3-type subunit 3
MRVRILAALAAAAVAAAAAAAPSLAQAPGSFTADQAKAGTQAFTDNCSACHGVDFTGGPGAPSLKGPEFVFGWNGKSAAELYAYVHEKMPPGSAGTLPEGQYYDIVAAILNANGVPAGPAPLAGANAAGLTIKPAG